MPWSVQAHACVAARDSRSRGRQQQLSVVKLSTQTPNCGGLPALPHAATPPGMLSNAKRVSTPMCMRRRYEAQQHNKHHHVALRFSTGHTERRHHSKRAQATESSMHVLSSCAIAQIVKDAHRRRVESATTRHGQTFLREYCLLHTCAPAADTRVCSCLAASSTQHSSSSMQQAAAAACAAVCSPCGRAGCALAGWQAPELARRVHSPEQVRARAIRRRCQLCMRPSCMPHASDWPPR